MTTILPSARGPWDLIGSAIGENISQNLPGAVQQGYQRQMGMNALEQAKGEIAAAEGDPMKIAMAMSRMAIASPEAARALGPIAQTAMQQAKVGRAFPNGNMPPQQTPQMGGMGGQIPMQAAQNAMAMGQGQQPEQIMDVRQSPNVQAVNSNYSTPSPFNIKTVQDMQAEAQRWAQSVNDPEAYNTRFAQLQAENNAAVAQRESLEDFALKSGVSPSDLPLYMKVGSRFNPRNPTEWARNAEVAWKAAKSNMDKLDKAFIPGLGSGLLGRDREKDLSNLQGSVQDLVKAGLEQETREKLAKNYLTPTEIEGLIHPLSPRKMKAIEALPKGIFPEEKITYRGGFPQKEESGFISYEEAKERAPKEMKVMQDKLADFFLKNLDKDTSILQLRDKILKNKDYDWRQIGPAIRQAEEMGLKLEQFQSTEMTDVETQPPYDSLPYIFRDLDRIPAYIRGNK